MLRLTTPIFILFLLTSCATFQLPFSSGPRRPADIEKGRVLRESGDYRAALRHLDRELPHAWTRKDRATIQYERGLCLIGDGLTLKAREAFRAARSWSTDREIRAAASIEIGFGYLRAESYGLAEHYLEQAFAEGVPKSYSKDHLTYHLAVICQRSGDEKQAEEYFGRVESYRPPSGSPYVYRKPVPEPEPVIPSGSAKETFRLVDSMIARERWHARPAKSNRDPMEKMTRITIHHTATDDPGLAIEGNLDAILKIQMYHQSPQSRGGRGWADIGYHFLIDRRGRIYEGRSLSIQGAHVGGDGNRGNIGIALIGSFETEPPSSAQIRGLRRLVGELRRAHGIAVSGIFTHRQFGESSGRGRTVCPGPYVERAMAQLRKDLLRPNPGRGFTGQKRPFKHVVRRGESLYRIARQYGAEVTEIVASNEITQPNRIRPGEILLIPASAP